MKTVTFGDAELFYRYDRGFAVAAKVLRFSSHAPRESDRYAVWVVQAVGAPTVPSTQEIGVADYAERTEARLLFEVPRGGAVWRVAAFAGRPPSPGWEVSARDYKSGVAQFLGDVVRVWCEGDHYALLTSRRAEYDYAGDAYLYFYRPAILATDNLLLARRAAVRVVYDYEGPGGKPRPAPVVVERRHGPRGRMSFFFPAKVAEIGEGEAVTLDAGYYAFVACHPLAEIEVQVGEGRYRHHYTEAPAPFAVVVEGTPWANAGYLLAAGLTARNAPQDEGRRRAPGDTILFKNGSRVFVDDGRPLATPGDVFLARGPAGGVYVAWNDVGWDATRGRYFSQCKVGKFAGAAVRKLFVDRWGEGWWEKPAYEIVGGVARFQNALWGGRRRLERGWRRTGWQVVWAAPPQDRVPADFDGGGAAVLMVPGDRTDLLRPGAVIRLGAKATVEPGPKEYVVAEAGAGVRHIEENSPYALDDNWRGVTTLFTWAVVLEVNRLGRSYAAVVRAELLGKYIAVALAPRQRYELWRWRG